MDDNDSDKHNRCEVISDSNYIRKLMEIRDREWNHVGHEKQFKVVRKESFKKLMLMVLQVHLEMIIIINIFHGAVIVDVHLKTKRENNLLDSQDYQARFHYL